MKTIITIIAILLFPSFTFAMTNKEVLHGINQVRAEHEVSPVRRNVALQRAAQERADYIAKTGKFEHGCVGVGDERRCPFEDAIERTGYVLWFAGENLAEFRKWDVPTLILRWLKSKTHHDIMLDPIYRDLGVGIAQGGGHTYVVTLYALKWSAGK